MLTAFLLVVVCLSGFGGAYLLPGCLLGLLLECAGENDELLAIEEAKQAEDVAGLFDSDFPEVIRAGHFL